MKHTIYSQKSSNNKSYKKLAFILTVLLIIAAGGFLVYKHFYQKKNNTVYSPPTAEEKQSGNDVKPEIVKMQEQEDSQKKDNSEQSPGQQPASSSNATIIITDAGQYDNVVEVRAFVSNRYQDGTCKITLTKNGLTVSKTTEAYKDATTTICTNPLFDRSEFKQAGDWQVIVEYTAGNISGKSKPQTVKIE